MLNIQIHTSSGISYGGQISGYVLHIHYVPSILLGALTDIIFLKLQNNPVTSTVYISHAKKACSSNLSWVTTQPVTPGLIARTVSHNWHLVSSTYTVSIYYFFTHHSINHVSFNTCLLSINSVFTGTVMAGSRDDLWYTLIILSISPPDFAILHDYFFLARKYWSRRSSILPKAGTGLLSSTWQVTMCQADFRQESLTFYLFSSNYNLVGNTDDKWAATRSVLGKKRCSRKIRSVSNAFLQENWQ